MILTPTTIAGAFVVELEPHLDSRGWFARAFCKREFAERGIDFDIVQCNLAHTNHAGVVRGLHFQEKPAEEAKLVRCVAGAVFDILVDMRVDSPTFRSVVTNTLDSSTHGAIYVPAGVAHGYQALTDNTLFLYMTDQYYSLGAEKGVRHDDPALDIGWPLEPRHITTRDRSWPLLVNW